MAKLPASTGYFNAEMEKIIKKGEKKTTSKKKSKSSKRGKK